MVGPLIPPAVAVVDHERELAEARRARADAERAVDSATNRLDELHEVTQRLRTERTRNQFAARMAQSFRSRPP